MATMLDDLDDLKLYNKDIYLPLNDRDRSHGSSVFLMMPRTDASKDFLSMFYLNKNSNFKGSPSNWNSYFLEKDVSYYINNESHMMGHLNTEILLEEDGEVMVAKTKGTLSEFNRVEITEENIEEHMDEHSEIAGCVPYIPWKGYLYLNEQEKLVACLNVNIEDKAIEKLFVTDEKYNYLYPELIAEARKMKANEIFIEDGTPLANALKEFGFSITENIEGNTVKMQFKLPISEATMTYGMPRDFFMYINTSNMYKLRDKRSKSFSDAVVDACMYYGQKLHLNLQICYMMSRFRYVGDSMQVHNKIVNDLTLMKYVTYEDIMITDAAIQESYLLSEPKGIYSRVLHDSILLAYFTDINCMIFDAIDTELDKYEEDRDPLYIYQHEVDHVIYILRSRFHEGNFNDFLLKNSYTYYRSRSKKALSIINSDNLLIARIEDLVPIHKTPGLREERDIIGDILRESADKLTDSYGNDTTPEYEILREKAKPEIGFVRQSKNPKRGVVITDSKKKIKGAVKVNRSNTIEEFIFSEDLSPQWMLLLATHRYDANKICIPEECKAVIEAFETSPEWMYSHKDSNGLWYSISPQVELLPYKRLPMTEEVKVFFSSLSEKDYNLLDGDFLSAHNYINSTLYRNFNEKGICEIYVRPDLPRVGNISICVKEEYRNKGIGKLMVKEAIEYARKNLPLLESLLWNAKVENEPSIRLMKKSGFQKYYEGDGYVYGQFHIHHTPDLVPNTYTEESDEWSCYGINLESAINDKKTYMVTDEELEYHIEENALLGRKLKEIMWQDRIKSNKEILVHYDEIKQITSGKITHMHLNPTQYKRRNVFIDVSHYMMSFFTHFKGTVKNKMDLFLELVKKTTHDKRFSRNGYNLRTILISLDDWNIRNIDDLNPNKSVNPISAMFHSNSKKIKEIFKDSILVFYTDNGNFFKIEDMNNLDANKFRRSILTLIQRGVMDKDKSFSKRAKMHTALDNLSNKGVKINSIIADEIEDDEADPETIEKEKEVVKNIEKAAENNPNPEDMGEDDEYTAKLIQDIEDKQSNNVQLSAARSKRMTDLSRRFLEQKYQDPKGKVTLKDYIDSSNKRSMQELPVTSLPVDSLNEDWDHMQFMNFNTFYDVRADIFAILSFFQTRSIPLGILDVKIEDTSTSEDWKETWSVKMEDINGKRFTFKFDEPILKDNKFMKLGGNDKNINGQLVLLPVSKTDEDTVQLVSNYNKIFIRRFSVGNCRSTRTADKFAKALDAFTKNYSKDMKIIYGDSTEIANKYILPFDYLDLSTKFFKIKMYNKGKLTGEIFFNQDNAIKELEITNEKDSNLYLGWHLEGNKKVKDPYQDIAEVSCTQQIINIMIKAYNGTNVMQDKFFKIYDEINPANRHTYSKASILATEIPVIVIMAYNEGLTEAMKKGHVKFIISEKRNNSLKITHDVIKFKDGFIYFEDDYNASLLMNGLKEVDTQNYSLTEINDKLMWTEALDDYGGRIKADGLDNFYDLMMDPITVNVCEDFNLPTDYCEMLAYSNLLLADNGYIKHTDLASNRFRTNELIPGYTYKCISKSYASYRNQMKRDRNTVLAMKQTAILDALMIDPTMADHSIMNPLLEMEAINAVSFKGLTGMNSDRSYSLDKRTYDPSMVNKVAMSTGFAGNVGVNRQTTIDMKIKGSRGYIKNATMKDASDANTLSMTEALTPFGTTRDDPFRTAMTYIQTAKHNMRVDHGFPLLVSNGSDQAIAYLTGDTFAFKAKDSGKVIKKTDDIMLVQYDNGKKEIIDLRENVKKNSDGGFYVTVKLDTNLKVGSKFKKMDILAYDKCVYSSDVGPSDNIRFNIGAIGNVAILNTDEGFEDSAIISKRLADDLTSQIVVMISKNLPANTNIFFIAKKGDKVQEGDTLLLYQSPFEEEDANAIVKKLSMDAEEVSEMGRIPLHSKVTGIVQDIKVYRTVEYSEMSTSLRKICKEYDDKVQKIKVDADKASNKIDLEANYKLPATSKMKNCENKVKIEFYLKYNDMMGIGDKLVFMSALKGETKRVFPVGQEPYTDRHPDEIIDSFLPLPSVMHRMVASIKILTGLYKGIIELTRYMKEACGIEYIPYNPSPTKYKKK